MVFMATPNSAKERISFILPIHILIPCGQLNHTKMLLEKSTFSAKLKLAVISGFWRGVRLVTKKDKSFCPCSSKNVTQNKTPNTVV